MNVFYKNSKLIDKDGIPMILYHGTPYDFNVFSEEKIGTSSGNNGFLGRGFYFTKDFWRAQCYGKVMSTRLNMENPLYIQGIISKETAEILNYASDTWAFEEGIEYTQVHDGLSCSVPEFPEIAEAISFNLQSMGYDGVVYGDYEEVVCFNAEAIEIVNKEK